MVYLIDSFFVDELLGKIKDKNEKRMYCSGNEPSYYEG